LLATALRHLQSGTPVDLLIIDVGLPGGMNGRQLAGEACKHRPDIKVLFVTGFAENAAVTFIGLYPKAPSAQNSLQ
jgi:DNA-binding NarL/FixJ family response regulator